MRGSEFGFKGIAELFMPLSKQLFLYGQGQYSTAFSTYYVSGKLGYRLTDWFSIGPEVSALGNDGFSQVRYGVAAAFGSGDGPRSLGQFIVSAGWADAGKNGSDGGYALGVILEDGTRF